MGVRFARGLGGESRGEQVEKEKEDEGERQKGQGEAE